MATEPKAAEHHDEKKKDENAVQDTPTGPQGGPFSPFASSPAHPALAEAIEEAHNPELRKANEKKRHEQAKEKEKADAEEAKERNAAIEAARKAKVQADGEAHVRAEKPSAA